MSKIVFFAALAIILTGNYAHILAEEKPGEKTYCIDSHSAAYVVEEEGRRHPNGGGVVGLKAKVDPSVFIDKFSCVLENAIVSGNVRLKGSVYVRGKAQINGKDTKILLDANTSTGNEILIKDNVKLKGNITIFLVENLTHTTISGNTSINGDDVRIGSGVNIGGWTVIRGEVEIGDFVNIKGYSAKHPLVIEDEAYLSGGRFSTGYPAAIKLFGSPHIKGQANIHGLGIKIFDQAIIGGDANIEGDATISGCTIINHGTINSGHHETPCADKNKLSDDAGDPKDFELDENREGEAQ